MSGIPPEILEALESLDEELAEGDITQKGYSKRRTQLLEASGFADYLSAQACLDSPSKISNELPVTFQVPDEEVRTSSLDTNHNVTYDHERLQKSSGLVGDEPPDVDFSLGPYADVDESYAFRPEPLDFMDRGRTSSRSTLAYHANLSRS